MIRPLLKEDSLILTLQNGLGNEERLGELFGAGRVLGGMAFVCINRLEDGTIHHTSHGLIRIGEPGGGSSERVVKFAEMFNASKVRCQILTDLRSGRWEKLVWNIPFNGLGAALDLTTEQLLATAEGLKMVREVMGEVIATAGASGQLTDLIEQQIEKTRLMGAYRTSMQIDRTAGRPLEIEAIIARPLDEARKAHIAVPRLEQLHELLRAVNPVDFQKIA